MIRGFSIWGLVILLTGCAVAGSVRDALIPKVRHITVDAGIAIINPRQFRIIAGSATTTPAAAAAEKLLKQRLKELPEKTDGQAVDCYLGLVGDKLFAGSPVDGIKLTHPQEYVLRFKVTDGKTVVYAAGADNRGVFYAAATLRQLLGNDGLSRLDISDYPDWQTRYIGGYFPILPAQMLELAELKIDGYGIQHRYDWRAFQPDQIPKYGPHLSYRELFEKIREFRIANGDLIDFMMMINVYCGKRLDASAPEDLALLIKQCRFAAGYVQEIMIQFDDYTPQEKDGFGFVSDGEKKKFRNPGVTHGYILKCVYAALHRDFPQVRLSMCPAPYSLDNHHAASPANRAYLEALSRELPAEVPIVWTGRAVVSSQVTAEDYRQYQQLVRGHRLYLWDNSSCSPTSPMDIWKTEFFADMSCRDRLIYINGHGFSFFWSLLFAINANDYLWNQDGYRADTSYAAAFQALTGCLLPRFVADTQSDLAQLYKTWDRSDRARIARRILDRKAQFEAQKIDFNRISQFVKPIYEECTRQVKSGTIPRLSNAPKENAAVNDRVWQDAAVYRLAAARYPATVRIGYTADTLYVRFQGNFGKAAPQRSLSRDSALDPNNDVFYLGLQPPLANHRSGWIAIDRSGNQSDVMEWQPAGKFNPKIRKTIVVDAESWRADLAIPFQELAGSIMYRPPQPGVKWRINLVRRNQLDGEISSWAPVAGNDSCDKKFFGEVIFK